MVESETVTQVKKGMGLDMQKSAVSELRRLMDEIDHADPDNEEENIGSNLLVLEMNKNLSFKRS